MSVTRATRLVAAAIGFFAVFLQYAIFIQGPDAGAPPAASIRYFSYFTVLTNLLAATAMAFSALAPATPPGRFFSSAGVRTAITVYILIVGLVYHFVLSPQFNPQGWSLLADTLLHYVAPAWFVVDWFAATDKRGLHFGMLPAWLAVPLAYGAYVLLRGAMTGEYPYFFLEADELGYFIVGRNLLGLLAIFALFGASFIALARILSSEETAPA